MPRGFLVKRLQKHVAPVSYRVRRYSDEDRSDSSSDHDLPDVVVPVQRPPMLHHHHHHHHTGASGLVLAYRGSPHLAYADPDDPERRTTTVSSNNSNNNSSNHNIHVLSNGSSSNNNNNSNRPNIHHHHHHLHPALHPLHHSIPLAVHAHHSPASSPLSLTHGSPTLSDPGGDNNNVPLALTTTRHPPFYLSGFDRLAVTPSTPPSKVTSQTHVAVAPPSPHKKRLLSADGGAVSKPARRSKAVRRLAFDDEKTSPVSGTIIREPLDEEEAEAEAGGSLVVRQGDIDPSFNVVEITDEAKAEIAKIENRLGDYICQLCKRVYEDAFGLAQHRCSRIVHVEYRCPECDKVFNCPANLASHRRWHKPRPPPLPKSAATTTTNTTSAASSPASLSGHNTSPIPLPPPPRLLPVDPNDVSSPTASPVSSDTEPEGQFECETCGKKFRRQAYLRKHVATHRNQTVIKSDVIHHQQQQQQQHHHRSLSPPAAGNETLLHHPSHISVTATIPDSRSTPSPIAAIATTTDTESQISVNCGGSVTADEHVYTCKYCTCVFSSSPGLTRHINKFHPSETRQVILLQLPPAALRTNAQ